MTSVRGAIFALCSLVATVSLAAGPAALAGTVRVGDRPEPNAVVWLDVPAGPGAQRGRVVLDQRNSAFSPRVLAVRVGTTVDFPNNDRVFHNVFSFRDGKRFDLGLYPIGAMKRILFDRPGLSRIFCNIHPQMAAYIMAVDSPFFAVSDADGRFTLEAVPAGHYRYYAWRPGEEIASGQVDARDGASLDVRWP